MTRIGRVTHVARLPARLIAAVVGVAVSAGAVCGTNSAHADLNSAFDNSGLSQLNWNGASPSQLLTSGHVDLTDLKIGGNDATGADFTAQQSF